MKIIIATDKFKGSLTSFEVCRSVAAGIKLVDPEVNIYSFPMADGGDGFAAVLKYYRQTQTVNFATVDPLNRTINASYEWDEQNKTAIIELAVASGLALLKDEERNPLLTSTYGTGLLIDNALKKGAKKIILGLGGSATNDAGTGILKALGFVFLDANEKELKPLGGNLLLIKKIVRPAVLPNIIFEIACDVQNPMFGENGAAFVYAPQKGADIDGVHLLDKGLRQFNEILFQQTGKDTSQIAGTGAAGGIAAGLMCYFSVELKSGIDMVVLSSGIESVLPNANIVITGEGRIDDQSKEGKVVQKIAALAKQNSVPVIGLCGSLQLDILGIRQLGLDYASAICKEPSSLLSSINDAYYLLQQKAATIFLFYQRLLKKQIKD